MTKLIRAPLVVVATLPFCGGCTLIGLEAGASIDKRAAPRKEVVARSDVEDLRVEEKVEVQLHDGSVLTGTYQGLEWALPAAYGPRYESARRTLEPELQLPALGPGAHVALTSGASVEGDFLGVGPGFVRFVEPGGLEKSIPTHRIVTLTDAAGRSATGPSLDTLLAARRLPTLTGLRIAAASANQVVDHADVASVSRLSRPPSARPAFAAIGLAIDVMVVKFALQAIGESYDFSFDYLERRSGGVAASKPAHPQP